MKDSIYCPICNEKLINSYYPERNLNFMGIDKTSNFANRWCSGLNHSLILWSDLNTKIVDHLKVSLTTNYSQFIWIDFYNNKCQISFFKSGVTEYLDVPRIIEPDFPSLTKLKEKVSSYLHLI